jgi:hypothetical protein
LTDLLHCGSYEARRGRRRNESSPKNFAAVLGNEPPSMNAAAFKNLIAAKVDKWGKVIRAANIKAE